jgi:hypothetical protein
MPEIRHAELEEAGRLHEEVSAYLEFWAIAMADEGDDASELRGER